MGSGRKVLGWGRFGGIGNLDRRECVTGGLPSGQQLSGGVCETEFGRGIPAIQRFANERSSAERQGPPSKRLFFGAIDPTDHVDHNLRSLHRSFDGRGRDFWRAEYNV